MIFTSFTRTIMYNSITRNWCSENNHIDDQSKKISQEGCSRIRYGAFSTVLGEKNGRMARASSWNPYKQWEQKHHQRYAQNHVAEDDFETSVFLTQHMQSGHGTEYTESDGLLISFPFESLCARIFSICHLKLFHPIFGLSNNKASFLLSGLIVLECPPYKNLLWPNRKWGKFPPWVVTNTSLWRQTV